MTIESMARSVARLLISGAASTVLILLTGGVLSAQDGTSPGSPGGSVPMKLAPRTRIHIPIRAR